MQQSWDAGTQSGGDEPGDAKAHIISYGEYKGIGSCPHIILSCMATIKAPKNTTMSYEVGHILCVTGRMGIDGHCVVAIESL